MTFQDLTPANLDFNFADALIVTNVFTLVGSEDRSGLDFIISLLSNVLIARFGLERLVSKISQRKIIPTLHLPPDFSLPAIAIYIAIQ